MKCPRCESEETSLSWLHEHSVAYWCRVCHKSFDISRESRQARSKAKAPPDTDETPQA